MSKGTEGDKTLLRTYKSLARTQHASLINPLAVKMTLELIKGSLKKLLWCFLSLLTFPILQINVPITGAGWSHHYLKIKTTKTPDHLPSLWTSHFLFFWHQEFQNYSTHHQVQFFSICKSFTVHKTPKKYPVSPKYTSWHSPISLVLI